MTELRLISEVINVLYMYILIIYKKKYRNLCIYINDWLIEWLLNDTLTRKWHSAAIEWKKWHCECHLCKFILFYFLQWICQ